MILTSDSSTCVPFQHEMDDQQTDSVFFKITNLTIQELGVLNERTCNEKPFSPCLKRTSSSTNYWEWDQNLTKPKKNVSWSESLEEIVFFVPEDAESRDDKYIYFSNNGVKANEVANTTFVQKDLAKLISLKKALFTSSNDSF